MSKKLKIFGILAIAILLTFPGNVFAARFFCTGMVGTVAGGTLIVTPGGRAYGAFVILPGDSNNHTVVTSISVTSDSALVTANAYVYDKEDEAIVDSPSITGTRELSISSGGGNFDAADLIVIQDPAGKYAFVESVASSGAGTILVAGTLDRAVGIGWRVYEMEEICRIPASIDTQEYESDVAVVAGEYDSPVLIWLGGLTSCSINFAAGHYK